MRILWRNFPLPEPFIVALLAGGVLQVFFPISAIPPGIAWLAAGIVLIITGIALVVWAALAARENDLANPTDLVTGGPYTISRNPMYLGWLFMAVGLTLLFKSLWLAVASLFAFLYMSFVTIPGEEATLQDKFGVKYDAYRTHTRRWL